MMLKIGPNKAQIKKLYFEMINGFNAKELFIE